MQLFLDLSTSLVKRSQTLFCLFLTGLLCCSTLSYGQSLVTVNTTDSDCKDNTGSITLTPTGSGSYSYNWSTGATSATITGLTMGDYSCTVTDGTTTETVPVSIYRPWELERFIPGDNTLSIVGNSVTMNPSLPYSSPAILDQRSHAYDKTPINVETQTGSIFAKFTKNHSNFPNQIFNPNPYAPPVFYIELFAVNTFDDPTLQSVLAYDANLKILVGGHVPYKIFVLEGSKSHTIPDYKGYDYTDGDEFEIRFLGNHQIQVYLEGTLIHSATLPRRGVDEYVAAVGFNDYQLLDRRVAYDLKSSFCTLQPWIRKTVTHSQKYGSSGEIELRPVMPHYINDTYTYLWNTGQTESNISGLSKGTYIATITSGGGSSQVLSSTIYDKLLMEPASTNSVVKIVDNSVTVDPALPMQNMWDNRTHAYDPSVPIDIVQGGGSVKFRISGQHPNFPNQHTNTGEYFKGIHYIELQEAVSPLPPINSAYDYPFKILFLWDGRISVANGYNDNNYNDPSNLIPNVLHHLGGLNMELKFLGNKVFELYIDDILVKTETLNIPFDVCYFVVGFHDGDLWQRRIAYNLLTDFDSKALETYAELKHELDGSYVQQTDDVLRVKFQQEYAVDPANGYLDIPYNIYDWERTAVKNGTLRVNYGVNWESIDLSGLTGSTHYTLEFNANKEEQYLLRFKTK